MTKQKLTYVAIVPLIGGLPLGMASALNGQLPEYVLSYSPFKANDSHYIEYIRKTKGWTGDYVFLDEDTTYAPKTVDIVGGTCPCAGLSSLSVTSSGDSEVNKWMFTTAKYVLETVKPKVFWGENAPRLISGGGKIVADTLAKIGADNGYSFNIYYTEGRLHGNPQKRPRTFYFFTKREDGRTPLLSRFNRTPEPIESFFSIPLDPSDPMNVLINTKNTPDKDPWISYTLAKTGCKSLKEYYDSIPDSMPMIWAVDQLSSGMVGVSDWFKENGFSDNVVRQAAHMRAKVELNKGYWGHGTTIGKGIIPSLVAHLPSSLVDAERNRYMTVRDCLRIMKMPEDFNLAGDNPRRDSNHVCQNVVVSTAADMASEVIRYLTAENTVEFVSGTYVRQNNANGNVTVDDSCGEPQSSLY